MSAKQKKARKTLEEMVKELSARLDKAEAEITKLRGMVQSKNRRIIHDWLNQTNQTPVAPFDTWRKEIQVRDLDVDKMMNGSVSGGLMEGVISCVEFAIEEKRGTLPLRCFTQKPKTFYIYSVGDDGVACWRIVRNETETFGVFMEGVERRLRRKYNAERRDQEDDDDLDKNQLIMEKINGTRMPTEKRIGVFKKWLFSKLEENMNAMALDSEFV
jgi:hypothetical protein